MSYRAIDDELFITFDDGRSALKAMELDNTKVWENLQAIFLVMILYRVSKFDNYNKIITNSRLPFLVHSHQLWAGSNFDKSMLMRVFATHVV
jgi:hypothetical protein